MEARDYLGMKEVGKLLYSYTRAAETQVYGGWGLSGHERGRKTSV